MNEVFLQYFKFSLCRIFCESSFEKSIKIIIIKNNNFISLLERSTDLE